METAKKIALITGANKGIGFEVARQIGRAGWTVIAAARNQELGIEAVAKLCSAGSDAHFIKLDLDKLETAAAAADEIRDRFGRLDLLINNAGTSRKGDGPPSKVDVHAVEATMHTNFVGSLVVTQAMLPLLLNAGTAQIINVSSELGSITQQTNKDWKYAPFKLLAYCASKAALNMLTVQLAYEFRDKGIAINSVNPGYTATDLNNHRGSQTVEKGAAEIVRVALLDPPVSGRFLEAGGELSW